MTAPRCTYVDRDGRQCSQPAGHAFGHVPEEVPGVAPGPSRTNWPLAVALATLGVILAGIFAQALTRI